MLARQITGWLDMPARHSATMVEVPTATLGTGDRCIPVTNPPRADICIARLNSRFHLAPLEVWLFLHTGGRARARPSLTVTFVALNLHAVADDNCGGVWLKLLWGVPSVPRWLCRYLSCAAIKRRVAFSVCGGNICNHSAIWPMTATCE